MKRQKCPQDTLSDAIRLEMLESLCRKDDRLYVLPHWHRINEFLTDFRILVAKRNKYELEHIKQVKPYIAEHWDSFTIFPIPDEISAISSSAFREKLHNNDETAKELVTKEVWEIMEPMRPPFRHRSV